MSTQSDLVKELTEKTESLVLWIAEIFRGKNWVKKLLLIDVLIFVFLNKPSISTIVKTLGIKEFIEDFPIYETLLAPLIPHYTAFWWLFIAAIFLAAVLVAIKIVPRKAETPVIDISERSPIKGLLSFQPEDAEIFMKLQRQGILKECLEALTHSDFRFGILTGESGSGKTSFLQAGLKPALLKAEYNCVYVKFSNFDPLKTIRQTIFEQIPSGENSEHILSQEEVVRADLLQLFNIAETLSGPKPVMFIFDQFEQFFVHNKSPEKRQSFVQAVAAWFKDVANTHTKILISIRNEFSSRLYEFQEVMDYRLAARKTYFYLEKFTLDETTAIFREIAVAENLEFEESFIKEMAAKELASHKDSLISPVDIQILALMVQKSTTARAFSRKASKQFGGFEGLLEHYLRENFEVPTRENPNQLALKVLLALTNLEQGVRAGELTFDEIQGKITEFVTAQCLQRTIQWLIDDLRLINFHQRQDHVNVYELAHERLVLPICKLSGKLLKDAARANQLLERRVNGWIESGENARYLLNWRELWLLKKHKQSLIWGKQEEQKKRLMAKSRKHVGFQLSGVVLLIGIVALFCGWWYSPYGQIWQVRRKLVELTEKSLNRDISSEVAIAFGKDRNVKQALGVVTTITDPSSKAETLKDIAEALAIVGDADAARVLLEEALEVADTITDPFAKENSVRTITEALAIIGDTDTAEILLREALKVANTITDPSSKARTLQATAEAFARIGAVDTAGALLKQAHRITDTLETSVNKAKTLQILAGTFAHIGNMDTAVELLKQARGIVETVETSIDNNAYALRTIAEASANIGNLEQAREITESIDEPIEKTRALREIAETLADTGDADGAAMILKQAGEVANTIERANIKGSELRSVAEALVDIGNTDKARALLEQARNITETINELYDKADGLQEIAGILADLGDTDGARALLEQARNVAETIKEPDNKAESLQEIAKTFVTIGDTDTAETLLEQVLKVAAAIQEHSDKRRALRVIVESCGNIGGPDRVEALLTYILDEAVKIGDPDNRDQVFLSIVQAYANGAHWREAHQVVVKNMDSDQNKASALATILSANAEQKYPQLSMLNDAF